MDPQAFLALLDWRRQVSELFAQVRARSADESTLSWFRAAKDALYKTHPQSPIPAADRPTFSGLLYWPWDPSMRVKARFQPDPNANPPDTTEQSEAMFRSIGTLHFQLGDAPQQLAALWIEGYAGGLFVPFRDATCGIETYGAGRYLLDTIKSADLGSDLAQGTVILDFNYAYHPSCAYDPRWVCPLAPPDSRLAIPIRAGERLA